MRDSEMQIGNNTSKSAASIQSKTALNAREMENLVTDQLEAVQQREHRDTRDFLGTRTSSRRSIKKEKKRANVATIRKTMPIVASVPQCCSNRKIGIPQAMDPTLHYKTMVTSQ